VRGVLGGNPDADTGLGVASRAWRTVVEDEATEIAYFDAPTFSQGMRYGIEDRARGQIAILNGELDEAAIAEKCSPSI
jgi:hypothetical protein